MSLEETPKLTIDETAFEHLRQARKWAAFLSVLALSLMGIVAVVMAITTISALGSAILTIVPLFLILIIYFFPVWYLYQFSRYAKQAVTQVDSLALTTALGYLKKHYRYMGILFLIAMVMYIISAIVIGVNDGVNLFQ